MPRWRATADTSSQRSPGVADEWWLTPALAQRAQASSTVPSRKRNAPLTVPVSGNRRAVSSPRATTNRKPPRASGWGVNADERRRPGRRLQHGADAAVRVLAAEPAVAAEPRPLAGRQPGQVVLAAVGDDDLAGRVVDRLDLVVDRGAAEPLRGEHRDRGEDVAGARPRHAGGRRPSQRPAGRDPDRVAEPELGHMAVERAGVQPVRPRRGPRARAPRAATAPGSPPRRRPPRRPSRRGPPRRALAPGHSRPPGTGPPPRPARSAPRGSRCRRAARRRRRRRGGTRPPARPTRPRRAREMRRATAASRSARRTRPTVASSPSRPSTISNGRPRPPEDVREHRRADGRALGRDRRRGRSRPRRAPSRGAPRSRRERRAARRGGPA